MSTVTTLQCDGENCKKIRLSDSNHWLYGQVLNRKLVMGFMEDRMMLDSVPPEKHFCGEQCAIRWFMVQLSGLREKTNAD